MVAQKVLLVSSQELGWTELRAQLQALADVEIVGETSSGRQALRRARSTDPDVILTADVLNDMPLVELVDAFHAQHRPRKIAVFAGRLDVRAIRYLIRQHDLQVSGYLLWSDLRTPSLRTCLEALLADGLFVLTRTPLLASVEAQQPPDDDRLAAPLTEREIDVLRHLALGLTRDEIARAQDVSLRTVNRLIATAEQKLHASSLFTLGAEAVRRQILP